MHWHTVAQECRQLCGGRLHTHRRRLRQLYDAESQELIEEIEGTSGVKSVAIWDGGKEGGKN